jgi:hypothetical protein
MAENIIVLDKPITILNTPRPVPCVMHVQQPDGRFIEETTYMCSYCGSDWPEHKGPRMVEGQMWEGCIALIVKNVTPKMLGGGL